nr:transmembrane and coiled-coil domain-containing protein 4-like [Tanacetum cinerariifolium]
MGNLNFFLKVLKKGDEKENEKTSDDSWEKLKRGGLTGAASITGGTLMAITGGLAAPTIALGVVIGAGGFAVASAAGSVAGSVAVAASFVAAGAGLSGAKMARRTGNVDEFEFKAIGNNHNQGRLAVEIMVAGFVFEEEDFTRPWEGQNDNMERTAIQDWLTSTGIAMEMMKQGVMMTVLSSLLSALALPATLLTLIDIIDSKWSIALDLMHAIISKLGFVSPPDPIRPENCLLKCWSRDCKVIICRPVTLIGFSLGARTIFKCLENLAESNHAGIMERVVLLGAPIAIQDENWEAARRVVPGRLINAYSTNDWMLGVAFRASLLS